MNSGEREKYVTGERPSGSQPPLCKLGVLCIHGIGTQKQGETLEAWGGVLVRWLKDWLKTRNGQVVIQRSCLKGVQLAEHTPAHAHLQISHGSQPSTGTSEWILAESWWADDFYAPPFGKLARWMLTGGSWVILLHNAHLCYTRTFGQLLGSKGHESTSWRKLWRNIALILLIFPTTFVFILSSFIMIFFVQLAVVVLAVTSLVPIPAVRSLAKTALLAMQGVLGDSYVFTSSDLARNSILNHVRDDLSWLEGRCDSVVVLAHSQGAAIAYHALAGSECRKVRRLITFGSGLLKLSELEQIASGRGLMNLARYAVVVLPLFIAFLPTMWHAFAFGLSHHFWLPWRVPGAGLYYLYAFLSAAVINLSFDAFRDSLVRNREYRNQLYTNLQKLPAQDFRWFDLFSTHDPVPAGSLFGQQKTKRFHARCVVNRMSMLSDHTAYWENLDEFVPLVIRELDGVANTGLMRNSAACRQLSWMRKKRKTRALLLRYCRMLVFLSAFVPMLIRWPQVVEFGKVGVSTYLPNAVVDKLTSVNSSVAETVGTKTALAVQDFTYGAMGVAAVSGIAFIWYCMMLMIWRSWDQRQMIEGFPSGASPPMLHVSSFSLKASAARIKRNFPQWAQQGCIVFMAGLSLYAAVRCGWFGGYHQLLFDLASAQHQISAAIDLFVRWLILACLGVAGMEMAVGGLILVFALAMLGYVSVRMWYNRTHKVPVKARQEEATRSQRT